MNLFLSYNSIGCYIAIIKKLYTFYIITLYNNVFFCKKCDRTYNFIISGDRSSEY